MLGIYIHVPFCKSKCPYCDFYSVNPRAYKETDIIDSYVDALIQEIRAFSHDRYNAEPNGASEVDTIYFGGGTPNLLGIDRIERILEAIRKSYGLDEPEVTMEINPATVDREFLIGLMKIGINRLSIGCQSFDNDILKSLGRLHRTEDSINVFNEAREACFDNISIDLMFGIPGQSMEAWKSSIEEALRLKPEHVSLYSLEFMEGTRFTRLLEEGKIIETKPEMDREMYEYAVARLSEAGIVQYEISNFAVPGYESRHNLKYWDLREYVGFGPGAHSYIIDQSTGKAQRHYHEPDIGKYLKNPLDAVYQEPNDYADDIEEYVITALRLNRGINLNEFQMRFGFGLWEHYGDLAHLQFSSFVDSGHAVETDELIALTLKGFNISNRILSIFV